MSLWPSTDVVNPPLQLSMAQLPCAIRVAHAQTKIGFVFARRGLVMEAASSFFLPRLIGFSRALYLTTTGATYRDDSKLLDGLYSEDLETPKL